MTRRPEPPAGAADPDVRSAHIPVALSEVMAALSPKDGETYIDGTFGAGGYTRAILDAARCRVLALDRDPAAIARGQELVARYSGRLILVETPFSAMAEAAERWLHAGRGASALVDGIVLDIGVSSMQLDEPERGFSFLADGPLDMRMSGEGMSAADFVNRADEEDIADVLYRYAEERRSRAIARAIVRARNEQPITRTRQLAEIVSRALGGRRGEDKHPATRTFQALRIHVNDELGELIRALHAVEKILKPGGRLVVVTFHSLEDRIVKRFLAAHAGKTPGVSRHLPAQSIKSEASSFRIVNPRPLTPSKGELELNPRARSARLRSATRTEAPPMAFDPEDYVAD